MRAILAWISVGNEARVAGMSIERGGEGQDLRAHDVTETRCERYSDENSHSAQASALYTEEAVFVSLVPVCFFVSGEKSVLAMKRSSKVGRARAGRCAVESR